MSDVAFWVGCGLLATGAVIFGLGFRSAKRESWEEFYFNNFVICSWAYIAYLFMAMHLGELALPSKQILSVTSPRPFIGHATLIGSSK